MMRIIVEPVILTKFLMWGIEPQIVNQNGEVKIRNQLQDEDAIKYVRMGTATDVE